MTQLYRQGDVLITSIPVIPDDAIRVPRNKQAIKGKGIVLAAGEVTGHHHVIRDRSSRLFRKGSKDFVRVGKNGASVTHEEHLPLNLPAGDFEITRQREYEPPKGSLAPKPRYVRD